MRVVIAYQLASTFFATAYLIVFLVYMCFLQVRNLSQLRNTLRRFMDLEQTWNTVRLGLNMTPGKVV